MSSSGALPEEGSSFLKGRPSFTLSSQSPGWNGTGEQLWLPQHPTEHSISSCGLEELCLGLFFMASLACQGYKQHKEEFQTLSPRVGCAPVCQVCAISAVEKRPAAEQEGLENPRGSTWILPESWQQIPGEICPHGLPIKEGEPQKAS